MLAAQSLLFATFFGVHKSALLKIFVSFQVSDVSCTPKRSERAKQAHYLYIKEALCIQAKTETVGSSYLSIGLLSKKLIGRTLVGAPHTSARLTYTTA